MLGDGIKLCAFIVLITFLLSDTRAAEPYSPVPPPKGRVVYVTPLALPAVQLYNDRLKNPATLVVIPQPCYDGGIKVHRSKPQERYFKDYAPLAPEWKYEPAPIMFDFSEPPKPQLIINNFVCPKSS